MSRTKPKPKARIQGQPPRTKVLPAVLLGIVVLVLTLIVGTVYDRSKAQTDADRTQTWVTSEMELTHTLPIVFYYEGVCAQCTDAEDFTAQVEEAVGDRVDYRLETIAYFSKPDSWQATHAERFPEAPELKGQVVRIGNTWLDKSRFDQELESVILAEAERPARVYSYYHHPQCPDCQAIADDMAAWQTRHPEYFVWRKTTENTEHRDELRAMLADLKVQEEDWQIPFIAEDGTDRFWTIRQIDALITE